MSELKTKSSEPASERARDLREDQLRPRPLDYVRNIGELFRPANLRERFSRERISHALRTFAWVAPLTILIWIWAEREQQDELTDQTVPIDVRLPGTNKVATIVSPPERNVVVSLRGPRVQLDAIRAELSQRAMEQRVVLQLDANLEPGPQEYNLPAQGLLQQSDFFRPYGVSITEVRPARLTIVVSELETIEVPVHNPPADQFPNIGTESVYNPPTVRITGKKEDLNGGNGLFVYPDLTGRDLTKPGAYELKNLPLLTGPALRDKQVTIQPATVSATLQVRQANISYTMNSMPVFVSHPADLLDKYQVQYDPFLDRVTLIGPREMIEAIANRQWQGTAPKARIEIVGEDLPPNAQPRSKLVQYDLPEGVTVSPTDKSRRIEVTVRERRAD